MVRWPEPCSKQALALFFATIQSILHVQDGNGRTLDLLTADDETPSHAANGFLAGDNFPELDTRTGLPPSRMRRVLADTTGHEAAIQTLLKNPFSRRSCPPATPTPWPVAGSACATRWPGRLSRFIRICV